MPILWASVISGVRKTPEFTRKVNEILYINGYFIKYARLDRNWVKETDKQYAGIELGSNI